MAKSLLMVILVSILMFCMAHPTFSQEIDPYSGEVPEDVAMSPTSDFDIYVESPDEAPFKEADSPAKEYGTKLYHQFSQKQLDFLETCVEKTSAKCADEIFKNIVDKTSPVTDGCCVNMRNFGEDCYLGLVKIEFSTYKYKNIASKAIPRSKQTWNYCIGRYESMFADLVAGKRGP